MDRLPVIVQSDRTILLEVENPRYEEARDALAGFAELLKSPEHMHTYQLSALSLWNAMASGLHAAEILDALARLSQYPVPDPVAQFIHDQEVRFGRLKLVPARDGDGLWLTSDDALALTQVGRTKSVIPYLDGPLHPGYRVRPEFRGLIKQALAKAGWPVDDVAGYEPGAPLGFDLVESLPDGQPFTLRPYQEAAVRSFWGQGRVDRGNGVVVLPCGAGKTVVGLGAMWMAQTHTLILTTSTAALHQWQRELLEKSTLSVDEVGEYSATTKTIRPVTVTTYQMLTHRQKGEFPHFQALDQHPWGLIIYDEVHLLPAPMFRLTASLQARRRLGLTATLIREDGRAEDVFALIGPKRFDMPWKVLEEQGWIATASCREIRVALPQAAREQYAVAEDAERVRIAAENPAKIPVVDALLEEHREDHVLVIGQYLGQLEQMARHFNAPLITGKTPNRERERLYEDFRNGIITRLFVSKVGNFAIDLPDANVAIQISGTFGSRQEEAQRLGRILRPKGEGVMATFYSIVSEDTKEQEFAQKRQLFLCEQGYRYDIAHAAPDGTPRERLAPVIPFPAGGHA
ncbi:DNA repair helicase XPB [Sulfobacillus harzensis]|uniref:DNA 3'-5' helicase n=1 Tax=Sulfobacillus harzensis TaxID=2729629 RepID=A0A7Y0L0Z0_9FIRM|nr:DNA repair helicase XPB [Sulfobacillus harzensis]NMP21299.1 DEAD/DEAH box helicase family protein [Sulfobacillus harzensis]